MKINYRLFSIIGVFSLFFTQSNYAQSTDLTAEAVFEKMVKHYDPDGKWSAFTGKVQLDWLNNGKLSQEYIRLDNANGLYECSKELDDGVVTRGVKDGKPFFKMNGETMPADEVPEQYRKWPYGMIEKAALRFQEHHTFHFSIPLTLHAGGAKPQEGVGKKNIFGADCLSISFERYPNAYEEGFYNGDITLYINPDKDYALHAFQLNNGWGEDKGGVLGLLDGEIEIDGIKVPGSKISFGAKSMKFLVVDILKPLESE